MRLFFPMYWGQPHLSTSLFHSIFLYLSFSVLVGSRTVRNKRQLIGATEDREKTVNKTSSIVWWSKMDLPWSHSQMASSYVLAEHRKVRFLPCSLHMGLGLYTTWQQACRRALSTCTLHKLGAQTHSSLFDCQKLSLVWLPPLLFLSRIRSYGGSVSEWFGVYVGVHQGSVLSPLLFIIVMEAVTHSVREGLPWEMLYADDLVLVGKCEEELKEKLRKWNECLKHKGLKINEDKTKVMCESFDTGTTWVVGNVKHPCSVCLKGVGVNSIRCTQCVQWVHARCSRVKVSLKNVESSFICRRYKGELCETRQVNN